MRATGEENTEVDEASTEEGQLLERGEAAGGRGSLNRRREMRSSIEVARAKLGSTKFPFHYSLHIYVASFPLTSTLDLFSIFLDKKNDLHNLFLPWGPGAPRSLGGAMFSLCVCHSYWFLKLSSGQIAAQPTKIMIHLVMNINYLSYLITFS